jgi:hypothetical protein
MERVFGIIPASSGAITFIWIICLVIGVIIIGVVGLLASFGYQSRHATFTVSDEGLRISPGIYSRFIPKQEIDTAGVKVVNLNMETEYKPKWRTNGAGLPGYSAGWFKLQNKEKALLFVTDRSNVVYIPTTENYSVLLSVKDADEFAELLQQWK